METNFKVDVPSFVLGYSEGKKKVPPSQEKEVTIKSNGKTEILPDEKQLLSKVTVNTNVELGFNIAYGTEPPEDTSKLWVKTEQPASNVIVSLDEVWENGNRPDSASALDYGAGGSNGGACRVGNFVYIFGGTSGTSGLTSIRCFNIETRETETLVATLSSGLQEIVCESVGQYIYLFGGRQHSAANYFNPNVYRFDTTNENIKLVSTANYYNNSNRGINGQGCVADGTKIHLLGGQYANSSGDYVKLHRIFDTEKNAFSAAEPMPVARASFPCVIADGYIYFFGGEYGFSPYADIYRYSLSDDTYEKLPVKLPNAALRVGACLYDRKIYLFGGRSKWTSGYVSYDTICYYDLDTKKLVVCKAKMTVKSSVCGVYREADEILVFRDSTKAEIYKPQVGAPTLKNNTLQIMPNNSENIFSVVKIGETRIEVNAGDVFIGNADNLAEKVEAALYKNESWVSTV